MSESNISKSNVVPLWHRILRAFLALSLVISLSPHLVFANDSDQNSSSSSQAALSQNSSTEGSDIDAGGAASVSSPVSESSSAEAQAEGGGTANAEGVSSDSEVAILNDTSEQDVNTSVIGNDAAEPESAADTATLTSGSELSSQAFVLIQSTKDNSTTYGQKYGTLNNGDVLWANMFDKVETEDYWGDATTETESVVNPGEWTYTWLASDTKGYETSVYTQELGHDQSLTVTSDMAGKYIICKVNAGGKDYFAPASTYDGSFNANYIPGPVLGAGQYELANVKLSNDAPSVGDTLTATSYISYSSQAPADANITYIWYSSSSQYSEFAIIEGQTGSSISVTDDLSGKYIKVEASAGVNKVSKTTTSKVKLAGEVELSAVSIINIKDNTSVFTVGDTAKARAKEKGGAYGAFVDPSKLCFQWQSCDTKGGTYADIEGATNETLVLSDDLGGKYLKCLVSSKIGTSSLTNSTGALIASAGSINVTSVEMSPSSGKVEVGATITATAKAASGDVTNDSHVKWRWYKGTSKTASSCNTLIEGQTSSSITVDESLKGFYVVATADGGYGEKKPYYAAGPVSVAGQVELYDVQFEGSYETNGVRVGNTIKSKVRKKDGSSYSYLNNTDKVTYQWQYSDTNTSYDSSFKDIPNATSSSYTVEEAYVGKYLRVKVTSENTLYSTQKKSSYGSGYSAKDPLGPVTLKGQYKLAAIELADKNVLLQVGSKLTPRVLVPGSYSGSTKDVPADAELTMAWYESSDNGATWTEITDGIDTGDGSLTMSDPLVGKRLKVTASALDNTVEWVSSSVVSSQGKYDLLRVITNPAANNDSVQLVTGDSISATVQAKRADGSTTNGIDVTKNVDVEWFASDSSDGEFTKIEGLAGSSVTLPDSVSNKYIKVVVNSGNSSVEAQFKKAVLDKNSLAAAIQKLNDASVQLSVEYSPEGGNVNDTLKAVLLNLGYADVDVKVMEDGVAFKQTDPSATVGISDAQDDSNGTVTFFKVDPNNYSGFSIDQLRYADVVFKLTRGDEVDYYQPDRTVSVAWDESALQSLLDSAAEQIAIGFAEGDSAESVTANMTLPYRAGSKNRFEVSWSTSDKEAVWVSGYGWSDYTGKVTRTATDREVTLTATLKLIKDGPEVVSGSCGFNLVVKGDPEKVAAEKEALQQKVDTGFTYDKVKYAGSDLVANHEGLTDDLQMPRPSDLGVDGKYYKVEFSASTEDVIFNGYRGAVYQPMSGTSAAATKITVTVTDKSNSEISATKTLDYFIESQDQAELEAELALMEQAKAGYTEALLDGQVASEVTENLHAFQKAYLKDDGTIAWSYSKQTSDSAGSGIVPVEIKGASETAGYRLFKSSKPNVVQHENLVVKQPVYNTRVKITSVLSSEKFARYAEKYPDNPTYAKLANQEVTATVVVKGSTGSDDPNAGKDLKVTAKVTGVSDMNADGTYTDIVVAPFSEVTVDYDDSVTAETILEKIMIKAGCSDLVSNSLGLTSAKLPDGRTLAMEEVNGSWSWWEFYLNGVSQSSIGAAGYYVNDGDFVEFRYHKGDGTKKDNADNIKSDPSAPRPDWQSSWPGYNNGGNASSNASTPVENAKEIWKFSYKDYSDSKHPNASEPLIVNDYIYLAVDGKLVKINKTSGDVVGSADLAGSVGFTSRPVYSQGVVVVPLDTGRLQALTADNLTTVWVTEELSSAAQSNSTLTVSGDYVYFGTVDVDFTNKIFNNGHFVKVSLKNGAVAWSDVDENEGYYWNGALVKDGCVVVATSAGTVKAFNDKDGTLLSSVSLGQLVNSDCVAGPDGNIIVMSRDGKLNVLSLNNGALSVENAFNLGFSGSASTPVIVGNCVYVGGEIRGGSALAVVDFITDNPQVTLVTSADGQALLSGGVKGAPLVSTQSEGTFVYFTVNGADGYNKKTGNYEKGGGIYRYRVGDVEATLMFDPVGNNQYCDSPIICDTDGTLYYINDSGNLFCVGKADNDDNNTNNSGDDTSDSTKSDPSVFPYYGYAQRAVIGASLIQSSKAASGEKKAADESVADKKGTSKKGSDLSGDSSQRKETPASTSNDVFVASVVAGSVLFLILLLAALRLLKKKNL